MATYYGSTIPSQNVAASLTTQITAVQVAKTVTQAYYQLLSKNDGNFVIFKDYNLSGSTAGNLILQGSLERGWQAVSLNKTKGCMILVPGMNTYYVISCSDLSRDSITIAAPTIYTDASPVVYGPYTQNGSLSLSSRARSINVYLYGQNGTTVNSVNGGGGAYVNAILNNNIAGRILNIIIGGGGVGGTNTINGGNGGNRAAIQIDLSGNDMITAAGGGGACGSSGTFIGGIGGATSSSGGAGGGGGAAGGGGTQISGGTAGSGATAGTKATGGNGGVATSGSPLYGGGGGGGGYYGGGGGAGNGGGGGGGSSYYNPTNVSSQTSIAGTGSTQGGSGQPYYPNGSALVAITYVPLVLNITSPIIIIGNSTPNVYSLFSSNFQIGTMFTIKNITATIQNLITDLPFIENDIKGFQIAAYQSYIFARGPSNFFFISVSDFTYSGTAFTKSPCSSVLAFTTSTGASTGTLIKGINIITSQTTATQKYYTLPNLTSADNGTIIIIKDGKGNAGSGMPITIMPPTNYAIENSTNSLNLISPYSSVWLMYNFTGIITTVAGSGTYGHTGNGGLATSATIAGPSAITLDTAGNLFFVEYDGILRMVANNTFSRYGQSFTTSYIYTIVQIFGLKSATIDSSNNIYLSFTDYIIRKIDTTGAVTTYSGNNTQASYIGDNISYNDPTVSFRNLGEILFDSTGNLFIIDEGNNVVRMIANNNFEGYGYTSFISGNIYTVAGIPPNGSGTASPATYTGDGGQARSATVCPTGIGFDLENNLYIVDISFDVIRKVNRSTGIITTVVGTGVYGSAGINGPAVLAELNNPIAVKFDLLGNMYIATYDSARIRMVDKNTGIIRFVLGNGTLGYGGDNGSAINANIGPGNGMAFDSKGNMYFSNTRWYQNPITYCNEAIRKITPFNNYSIINYCTGS